MVDFDTVGGKLWSAPDEAPPLVFQKTLTMYRAAPAHALSGTLSPKGLGERGRQAVGAQLKVEDVKVILPLSLLVSQG
ncbi:MAG: hypothetical protein LBC37_04170 [Zoogloeaceae bacterium]|nr:hypothetical protein [Zoogloeaceae bacterium]